MSCDVCGHDPRNCCAGCAQELFTCDRCERTICAACLREILSDHGMPEPSMPMNECAECDEVLCPDCWEEDAS